MEVKNTVAQNAVAPPTIRLRGFSGMRCVQICPPTATLWCVCNSCWWSRVSWLFPHDSDHPSEELRRLWPRVGGIDEDGVKDAGRLTRLGIGGVGVFCFEETIHKWETRTRLLSERKEKNARLPGNGGTCRSCRWRGQASPAMPRNTARNSKCNLPAAREWNWQGWGGSGAYGEHEPYQPELRRTIAGLERNIGSSIRDVA